MEDKDDVNLPKATLSKMIRDHLPSTMRVSADVVDLIIESCTEFIHLVSAEANEMCNKGEKRTIAPEHVIQALTELGFTQYVEEVNAELATHKEAEGAIKLKRKASAQIPDMTVEEQVEAQRAMFAAARARMQGGSAAPAPAPAVGAAAPGGEPAPPAPAPSEPAPPAAVSGGEAAPPAAAPSEPSPPAAMPEELAAEAGAGAGAEGESGGGGEGGGEGRGEGRSGGEGGDEGGDEGGGWGGWEMIDLPAAGEAAVGAPPQ